MTRTTNLSPPVPPRPKILDPDQVQRFAQVMGMKAREIVDIYPDPNGRGMLVTDHGGTLSLISPDDRYLGLYRPGNPEGEETNEPWTLADLAAAATRVQTNLNSGQKLEVWVNADGGQAPVRAFAMWQALADKKGLTLAETAVRFPAAAECRRIVLASGWLSPDEAAEL